MAVTFPYEMAKSKDCLWFGMWVAGWFLSNGRRDSTITSETLNKRMGWCFARIFRCDTWTTPQIVFQYNWTLYKRFLGNQNITINFHELKTKLPIDTFLHLQV